MTKFNPENKEVLTTGESLGVAMEITDPEDAKQYLKAYTEYIASHMKDERAALLEAKAAGGNIDVDAMIFQKALEIAKHNLGYWAGYYDDETRKRVEKLFACAHPVFGKIEENGRPTPEQAFAAGKKMARSKK